jgi:hypothetical protein
LQVKDYPGGNQQITHPTRASSKRRLTSSRTGHNGFQVLLPPPAGVRQNDPAYSPTTIRATAGQSSQDGDLQSLKRKETFMRLPIVRSAEASDEPAGADAIGSSLNSGVSLGVKTVV